MAVQDVGYLDGKEDRSGLSQPHDLVARLPWKPRLRLVWKKKIPGPKPSGHPETALPVLLSVLLEEFKSPAWPIGVAQW